MAQEIGAAAGKLRAEKGRRAFARASKLLLHYMQNIGENPGEPKFRKVHCANRAFSDRIGEMGTAAHHLMMACGWRRCGELYAYKGDAEGELARAAAAQLRVAKSSLSGHHSDSSKAPMSPRNVSNNNAPKAATHLVSFPPHGSTCDISDAMRGLALSESGPATAAEAVSTPGRRRHPAASPRVGRTPGATPGSKRMRACNEGPPLATTLAVSLQASLDTCAAWQEATVGWTVSLPGQIWGVYANDEETKAWSQAHSDEIFKTNVLGWRAAGGSSNGDVFTVQYEDEPSFEIEFRHLWQYLEESQRHKIVAAGAVEPHACEQMAADNITASSQLIGCCNHKLIIQLDGLPGSGKSYMSMQMERDHGFAVIELDEITQKASHAESLVELTASFHRELRQRLTSKSTQRAPGVILCGVSIILSEWGEINVIPSLLPSHKLWVEISPPKPICYSGALATSVRRLLKDGVSYKHVSELVESARRSVLRDLRDISPKHWAKTSEDWGGDSSFYAQMAAKSPPQLGASDYQRLAFEMEPSDTLCPQISVDADSKCSQLQLPLLSDWTALTLDDMTGEGESCEEYHLSQRKAEAEGFVITHWTTVQEKLCQLLAEAEGRQEESV